MEIKLEKGESLKITYTDCPSCHKTFNSKARKKTEHHIIPKFLSPKTKILLTICKECHEELNSHYDNKKIIESKSKSKGIKSKPESFEDFLKNYKKLRSEFEEKRKGKPKTDNGKFGEGLWTNLVNFLEVVSVRCDLYSEESE